ncbi:MAG: dehydrogenase [Planctomycetota bacterium]|nr:MAG: dehydrogenase [Planctomycetota bacterium]REK36006.1 MAG: dehydrogenase [Planctomycetota bacterium]
MLQLVVERVSIHAGVIRGLTPRGSRSLSDCVRILACRSHPPASPRRESSMPRRQSALILCSALLLAGFTGLAVSQVSDTDPAGEYGEKWHILTVPGTWDEQTEGKLDNYDGIAWYRCLITIPGGWREKEVLVRIENVDDAYEAFFNGTPIGGSGAFPPDYQPGDPEPVELAVPEEAVKAGKNLLAIRIFDHDGRGGFKGAAPVVLSGDQGINLNGLWEFRTGDDEAWAEGPVAITNTGIFWRTMAKDAAIELAKVESTALEPAEAAATLVVPDDLEVVQVLSEPEVRQPLYMNWDERGRLWVMNYIQYPYPAGLTMVSKDEYWRAVYDRLPEAPPNHFPGADRITIHEDTDGDGLFDAHKSFVEGLSIATSFTKGRGGVWVLNPPYLLFYPDADNDDVPDGDPEVHLQGFGFEDTHSVANSLRWGPDGWLYACQGSTVSGNILRPGIDKPEQSVHSMGQLIWRYHPESRTYEIFAEGGGNSFGCEFDAKGRVYSGHNGGNTRGFHYVQGGYYQKGFSKHGPLSNPYSFGYFPYMQHHDVPRFTHNFIIYEGGALPERYSGKLFGVEPMQGQVVQAEIFPDTSTFATRDINRPILTDDKWFRPVDIKAGPDGAIYVADMYEPQISHREHFSGQIDKSNGRIYRLQAKGAEPHVVPDLGALSARELIEVLRHPNKWYRQRALVLFGDRKDGSVVEELKAHIREETGQFPLECLWALNLSGGFDEEFAAEALEHADEFVRMWTVRLLCDDHTVSDSIADQLASMAAGEPYAQVRSQLASSARRLPAEQGLPIVEELLARSEDLADVHIPLLLWWAIESKAGESREMVLELLSEPETWELPIVRQHILSRLMRRYAAAGSRQDLITCAKLLRLAPSKEHTDQLMKGFEEAFQGRSLATLPEELVKAIDESGSASLVLQVRQLKPEAVQEALSIAADGGGDAAQRLALLQIFGEVDLPESVDVLLGTISGDAGDELKMAALTSLMRYDQPRVAEAIVAAFPSLSADAQAAALTALSSRAAWSKALLQAIAGGRIAAESIPLDTVRLMTFHQDQDVAELIGELWPDVQGASNAQMQAELADATELLKTGSGDPYRGKQLYQKSCGKCHLLFGDGGRIGPDLTSYQRKDQSRLLVNIVNPSAEIREGFESYMVLTEDGRVLSGFLFDQDENVIVLRGVDGQNVTIPRETIEEMAPQKKSLMPEGLLKDLNEQQIRDLFAFLQASQPLNN